MNPNRMPLKSSVFRWTSVIVLLVTALSAAIPAPALARPLAVSIHRYVAPAGTDAGDCTNPAAPCLTINYAIGQSAAADVINAAAGTYTGTSYQVVLVNKNITMHGGWDAGFTTQSGTSTIDGQDVRRAITIEAGMTAAIDHFTIQAGFLPAQGGGIYNAGTLTLSQSVLTGNHSEWLGGWDLQSQCCRPDDQSIQPCRQHHR
jgi:hypothetical protein